jgi:hypothetical protein
MLEDNHEDKALETIMQQHMDDDVPPEVMDCLQDQLQAFRNRVAVREYVYRPRIQFGAWAFRAALAASIALALSVGFFLLMGSGTAPTWADVAERFADAPAFNATVYVRTNMSSEPVQIELWMGQGSKLRMRAGNQVFFGENGRIVDTFSLPGPQEDSRAVTQARKMLEDFLKNMGNTSHFSLNSFLKALPYSEISLTSVENQTPTVSKDLAVFDIKPSKVEDNEWVRVWALSNSRLPVRVLFWGGANNGYAVDVMLSYSEEKPAGFFDAEAFRETLSKGVALNAPYVLMTE